jgi:dienelactone hydrolase
MLSWLLPLLALMGSPKTAPLPAPEIHTEAVQYKHGDVVLEGFLAYEKGTTAKRPGVVIVHEWRGHGDYVRRRAEEVAKLGYVAFAIDMYGKGVFAKDHTEAGKLAGVFQKDRKLMRERAAAGLERLKQVDLVDPKKIAVMGYCFGGTTALELARGGYDVVAAASFHGNLSRPEGAEVKPIRAKIAVFHGAADKFAGPEQLPAFADEMTKAGADWYLVSFGGAVHSFTVKEAGDDTSTGMAYNEAADRRSWEMLKNFLTEAFK